MVIVQIERIVVGFLKENCYIVTINGKSIIIDPGDEAERIIEACRGKQILGVMLTHRHFDHVGALDAVLNHFNINVLNEPCFNDMQIIETPGHTKDSLSFYFENEHILFSGDFLFEKTIGRVDLPTGDINDMKKSLELISEYPTDTKVYPGHGEMTILGDEIPCFTDYLQENRL